MSESIPATEMYSALQYELEMLTPETSDVLNTSPALAVLLAVRVICSAPSPRVIITHRPEYDGLELDSCR